MNKNLGKILLATVLTLVVSTLANATNNPSDSCYRATGLVTRSFKGVLRIDSKESGALDKLKVIVNEEVEEFSLEGLYVDLTFFRDKKGENRSHSKFVNIQERIPASSSQTIEKITCPKGLKKESLKVARAFKL